MAVRTVETLMRGPRGRRSYRRAHLEPPGLALRRERIGVRALPRAFDGFRVAQLPDFHAGAFLGRGDLASVVRLTNEIEPDVVALTGDFVTHDAGDVRVIVDDLGRLRARDAVRAVFGNHDYRRRREAEIARVLGDRGIVFLRNACQRVERTDGAIAFVGVEDLAEGRVVDLDAARARMSAGDLEIVLCHHPRGALASARPGCVAVLSGHTHGTQVDLPLLRRLGPPHPGARIDLGGTVLIVSRGLGVIGLPLRIGAPAEIVLLELERRDP